MITYLGKLVFYFPLVLQTINGQNVETPEVGAPLLSNTPTGAQVVHWFHLNIIVYTGVNQS